MTREEIKSLYMSGLSVRSIAERAPFSHEHIRRELHRMGARVRPRTFARRRAWRHSAGYIMWGDSYVHRIVCEAWYGPAPSDRHQVNHRDGDKANNHPDNLEWVTPAENLAHAHSHGLLRPNAKSWGHLDVAKVVRLRTVRMNGGPVSPVAREMGVALSTACRAIRGDTWKHVTDPPPIQRCHQSQVGLPS